MKIVLCGTAIAADQLSFLVDVDDFFSVKNYLNKYEHNPIKYDKYVKVNIGQKLKNLIILSGDEPLKALKDLGKIKIICDIYKPNKDTIILTTIGVPKISN